MREKKRESDSYSMQDQMEALMKMVESSLGGKTAGSSKMQEKSSLEERLCRLADYDDIEAYLTTIHLMERTLL